MVDTAAAASPTDLRIIWYDKVFEEIVEKPAYFSGAGFGAAYAAITQACAGET